MAVECQDDDHEFIQPKHVAKHIDKLLEKELVATETQSQL